MEGDCSDEGSLATLLYGILYGIANGWLNQSRNSYQEHNKNENAIYPSLAAVFGGWSAPVTLDAADTFAR